MSRFSSFLKNIDENLNLPEAARAQIIIEMNSDMEDMYHELTRQGTDKAEAVQKTIEAFTMEPETIRELEEIHQTLFRKIFYKAFHGSRIFGEKAIFYLGITILALLSVYSLSALPLQARTNKIVLSMFGLILIAFIFSLRKFYKIFVKKDYIIRRLKSGLMPLIYLAGMNLFIAVGGYYYQLFKSGLKGIIWETKLLLLTIPGEHIRALETDFRQMTYEMIQLYTVMIVGLVGTFLILVLWFFLLGKVSVLINSEYRKLISIQSK